MSANGEVMMVGGGSDGFSVSIVLDVADVSFIRDALLVMHQRCREQAEEGQRIGDAMMLELANKDTIQAGDLEGRFGAFLQDLEEGSEPYRCEICGKLGGH